MPTQVANTVRFGFGRVPCAKMRLRYEIVTGLVALVLVIASSMKAVALLRHGRGMSAEPIAWLPIISEMFLAWWIIAGIGRVWARYSTMLFFFILASVATWHLAVGESSCGCFGDFRIHPLVTVGFDLSVIACIWSLGRAPTALCASGPYQTGRLFLASALLVLPALFIAISVRAAHASGAVRVISIEPESWRGHRFPLLDYLDSAAKAELSNGSHTVIIIDRTCVECLKHLRRLSQAMATTSSPTAIRAIDIARAEDGEFYPAPLGVTVSKLPSGIVCLGDVPREVLLSNGVVSDVRRP